MRFRRMMVLVLAFWMVAVLLPANAAASQFRLRIENLTTGLGVVISDEVPGDGFIQVELGSALGEDLLLSLTMGFSKPALDGVDPTAIAHLNLFSVNMTTSGAAQMLITLEDTGYAAADPPGPLTLRSDITGSYLGDPGATLQATSYANALDQVPDLGAEAAIPTTGLSPIGALVGTAAPTLSFTSLAPGAFSSESFTAFEATGLYSMFTQVLVGFAGAGQIEFSQNTTMALASDGLPGGQPVPEPASLMLIATGLVGMGRMARRRYLQDRA